MGFVKAHFLVSTDVHEHPRRTRPILQIESALPHQAASLLPCEIPGTLTKPCE
jgi:hypothetical protein